MNQSSPLSSIVFIVLMSAYYLVSLILMPNTDILFNTVALIVIGGVLYLTLDVVQSKRHPFNMMIKPLIATWEQSLPWYVRLGLFPKTYVLCINLSKNQVEHTLVPGLKPAFKFRHQTCEIHGYYKTQSAILIEVSHPENDLVAIHQLWSELKKAGLYFKTCHLLLNEAQVDKFDIYMKTEWPLLKHILQKSHDNHLIIYEKSLHHDLYYACEYSACTIPWISYGYKAPSNVSRHQVNDEYDSILQSLLLQINDLCIISPIDAQLRKQIYLLPRRLALIKFAILNTLEACKKHKLNIRGIGLGFFHTEPPMNHTPWDIQRRLKHLAILLACLIGWQFLSSRNQLHHINQSFAKYDAASVMHHVLKLDPKIYNIRGFQSHIERSRDHFIAQAPTDLQNEVLWLLAQHKHNTVPSQTQSKLSQLLSQHEFPAFGQVLDLWASFTYATNNPDYRGLARVIAKEDIEYICQLTNDPSECAREADSQLVEDEINSSLDQLYFTLLPINIDSPSQAARQLAYLSSHRADIATNLDYKIKEIIPLVHQSEQRSIHMQRIHKVESIRQLLHSNKGASVLQALQKLFTASSDIVTDKDALLALQAAQSISEFALNKVLQVRNTLDPEHIEWFDLYTIKEINRIKSAANRQVAQQWKDVQHTVNQLKQHYPFNSSGEDATLDAFLAAFGPNGKVLQFYHENLHAFTEATPEGIIVKKHPLGIHISESMLHLIMHTQVIHASTDLDQHTLQQTWTLRLTNRPYPVTRVDIITGKDRRTLNAEQGTVIQWQAGKTIALECIMEDGSSHIISHSSPWGFLRLLKSLPYAKGSYHIQKDGNLLASIDMTSRHHVRIDDPALFDLPPLD